jgi:hypothetical protein
VGEHLTLDIERSSRFSSHLYFDFPKPLAFAGGVFNFSPAFF